MEPDTPVVIPDEGNGFENTSENVAEPKKNDVGFPVAKKKKSRKIIYIIIAVIVVIALFSGGYFLLSKPNFEEEELGMIESGEVMEQENTPTPTEQEEEVDRSEISIEILNGTGIEGQAGDTKAEMESLGYEDIEVGNASSKDYESTIVVFDSDVPQSVREEIVDALSGMFDEVDTQIKDMDEFDVQIITGYPSGHTPTPTTAASTSTPTPTEGDELTPTLTNTPTPTP